MLFRPAGGGNMPFFSELNIARNETVTWERTSREGAPLAESGPGENPARSAFGSERDLDARRVGRRYWSLSEK